MANPQLDISRYQDKNIVVLMGGMSSEREISLRSGENVYRALTELGIRALKLDADRETPQKLMKANADIVFNALHGTYGEDGCIQGMLEVMGIPYTGSGVTASAISMNKILSKHIWQSAGIPVAPWVVIDRNNISANIERVKRELGFPIMLKPFAEGSSVGVRLIKDASQFSEILPDYLQQYNQSFAEKYIPGTELTVGILYDGKDLIDFPILELRPKNDFYDYEAKYTQGMTDFVIPANISSRLTTEIQERAKLAFQALGMKGVARLDLILDSKENYYFLEANSLPGLTETSDIPAMAKAAGISFPELVLKILDCVELK